MIDEIVLFTNKRIESKNKTSNMFVDAYEVRGFIGLLLLFGVTKKNDVEVNEIWSVESLHHSSFASSAMARNRFKFIASYLTFDDIATRNERLQIMKGKFILKTPNFN